ncbi:MAG: T9SS type A sorting domain-containing protein [Chitinophagales bacterium]|nr:T9SS type A sorting domain-containing protein [Chitinophagales bacterium]
MNHVYTTLRKIIPLLMILFSAFSLVAQSSEFAKTIGGTNEDWAQSVVQSPDGGFVLTGITYSRGAGGEDVFLVKTNAAGDTVWCKTFGGSMDDYGYKIHNTSDGGMLITGHTKSFGAGDCDGYVIRTDANGRELWEHTYGGIGDDVVYGEAELPNGDFIMTGFTENFGAAGRDIFLIRTDAGGNLTWTKTIGGSADDYGKFIALTHDGNIVLGATTNSYGAGDNDFFLVKADFDGNVLWTKTIGGIANDDMWSMHVTTDGGFIMTGVTFSYGNGKGDCYLAKADAVGDVEWTRTFGGEGNDRGNSVNETSDGGYIMTGTLIPAGDSVGDAYLVKTDANGNKLWEKIFGGLNDDNGNSVIESSDEGLVIAGRTVSFGEGWSDVYFIKTDAEGNVVSGIGAINGNHTVSIFPNPIKNNAIIKVSGTGALMTIIISALNGEEVKRISGITSANIIFYRNQLPAGTYLYSLIRKDEVIDRGKIILE